MMPGQPGGHDVAADPGEHRDQQPGDDLHHADGEHCLVRGAGNQVVDLGGQVLLPVGEQSDELVQPEQDRRHREHGAQQQEGLVGGRGERVSVDGAVVSRWVVTGSSEPLKDYMVDVRASQVLSQ